MSENIKSLIQDNYLEASEAKAEIDSKIGDWIDLFDGKPIGNETDGRSKIVWKLIKKQVLTLSANLSKPFLSARDIVSLEPRTENDVIKTKIYNKLINYFWNKEFDRVKFMNNYSLITAKEGTCFLYVSWDKEVRTNEVVLKIEDENKLINFRKNGAKIFKNPDGTIKITIEKIIKNRPHVQIIPNEDIFPDPTAYSVGNCRYIIVRYPTTKEDLLSDPLYDKQTVNKFFSTNNNTVGSEVGDDLHDRELWRLETEDSNEEDKKIYVYEYWYREDNKVKVVFFLSQSSSEVEIIGQKDYDFNWYPFEAVPLFDKEFSIWGDSLAEVIADEQKFMTSIVRGVIDNMSMSNNGTKFIRKGALDSLNYKRLMEGKPVVEVNATGVPINQVVMDGHFNELPSSVYNMLQIIENQAEGLTGISKAIAGVSGSELNAPATNYQTMMNQAQIRLLMFSLNIQEGLKKVFCKWIQMCMKYLSDEEIEKITGINIPELKAKETMKLAKQFGVDELPEDTKQKAMLLIAKEVEDMFSRDDIKYDIKFRIGTDGLKQIRINQINMLMQQAGSLVQAGACPPDVIQKLLAKLTELMDFPELADEIENYQPQPDQIQQQMTQLEMMEKQAKAQKESALAQNALARTKATEVKAQKEAMSVDADIANKYADVISKVKGETNDQRGNLE